MASFFLFTNTYCSTHLINAISHLSKLLTSILPRPPPQSSKMFQRLARAKDRTKKRLSTAHNPTGTHNSHSTSQNSEFILGGVRRQSSQLIIHPRVVVPQVVTMLFHLPQLSSCAYPTCTPAVFIMLTSINSIHQPCQRTLC